MHLWKVRTPDMSHSPVTRILISVMRWYITFVTVNETAADEQTKYDFDKVFLF
jgi:hypothetical protein